MEKRDPRIDAYIENAADFAKPVLKQLRAVVHEACPECEEDVKWRHPTFMYKGILGGMAAFKEYCALIVWKQSLIVDEHSRKAMEQAGRMTSIAEIPSKAALMKLIKEAAALNAAGVKVQRMKPAGPKKPVRVPPDLLRALRKSKKAQTAFAGFSPSHRREYVEWITDAKTDETRSRRLATAVAWIGDGKHRNWKYE